MRITSKFSTLFILFILSQTHAMGKDCLEIGLIGEFKTKTGSNSQPYGRELKNGAMVAKKLIEVNDPSICIDFRIVEIQNSLANIPGVIDEFTKKGVRLFVGLGTSDQALVSIKTLERNKVILITPTASSNEISNNSNRIIMMFPRNSDISTQIASMALKKGLRRIITVYASNNSYSRDMAQQFKTSFERHGGKVEKSIRIRSPIIQLESKLVRKDFEKIDGVFLPLFEIDVAKTLREFQRAKIDVPVIGTDSWGTHSIIIQKLIKSYKSEIFLPKIYALKNTYPTNRIFVEEYTKMVGKVPTDLSAFSFDAVNLLKKMMEKCEINKTLSSLNFCFTKVFPFESTTGLIKKNVGLNLGRNFDIESTLWRKKENEQPKDD